MNITKIIDFIKKHKKAFIAVIAAILLMTGVISTQQFDSIVNVNEDKVQEVVQEEIQDVVNSNDDATTNTLKNIEDKNE